MSQAVAKNIEVSKCGINPQFEIFYIVMLKGRIDAALDCFECFKRHSKDSSNSETAIVWLIQSLVHVSAVSRFLWPSRNKTPHKARGETIRKALCISQDSTLKNRALRDSMEHFDERLDLYLQSKRSRGLITFLVHKDDPRELNNTDFAIYVNPEKGYLVALDERHEYLPIFAELENLRTHVNSAYAASRFEKN
jgi:hypothetical protein